MKKIEKPSSILIEKTAVEFAAVFYEAGRSSGLTSKYKDARAYARTNFVKFVPKVVNYFLDLLNKPYIPADQKKIIFEALQERMNDPDVDDKALPEIDMKKILPKQEPKPVIINSLKKPLDIKNHPLSLKV